MQTDHPRNEIHRHWAEALSRLSTREPFPYDRASFFYRPTELLGIVLGAKNCLEVTEDDRRWLRGVLSDGKKKLRTSDLWSRLLGAYAAQHFACKWEQVHLPEAEMLSEMEAALALWLCEADPHGFGQGLSSQKVQGVERAFLKRLTSIPLPTMDAAHASIIYCSLRRTLDRLIDTAFQVDNMQDDSRKFIIDPGSNMMNPEVEVFFSYSHADEGLRDELAKHLKLLERQGLIRGWHDRKILPGEEWKGQIDENLERAQVILLLVSSDFLASDYCYDIELKRALERHEAGEARVIPVILRHCVWETAPFGKLQAVPKNGAPVTSYDNRDEAFTDITRGLMRTVEQFFR
jgi:hypothetical protein